jgi:hypothetical protein
VLTSSGLKGKLGFCGVILGGWAIGDGVLFGIADMLGSAEAEGCEEVYLGRCGGASKDWTGDGTLASVEARGLFPSRGEGFEVGGRDRDFEVRGTGLPSSSLLKERLRGAFIAMMLG